MSVGNLRDNGNKGNNFPYQLNILKTLGLIAGSTAAGATEATLLQVLGALQNGQEFEQSLIIDATNTTYLMVRVWNTVTHTFDPPIYYNASGAVVTPTAPITLVNPQYVLENILIQATAINADLDVALSTRASELTLAAVKTVLDNIKLDTANLVPVNRTPGFTADSASVTPQNTPTGVVSYSLFFRGTGGKLNGVSVPDGYSVSYGNGKDPITVAMTYERPTGGTGAQVLITTLT